MSEIRELRHWSPELRIARGLLNGARVQMGREFRAMQRFALAAHLGLKSKELAARENDWCFWTEREQAVLCSRLDFPIAFFASEDAPVFGPGFMCGHDDDEHPWCELI